MNNLRWQPHWLPRLTSLPRKSRDSSLGQPTEKKNRLIFFFIPPPHPPFFKISLNLTSDSFVNHFDGQFAYLKTLDFSFKRTLYCSLKENLPWNILSLMFCLFVNALYEWNVTKTNSVYILMSLANKYHRIIVTWCMIPWHNMMHYTMA